MTNWLPAASGLVTVLGSAVAIIVSLSNRRKISAESDKIRADQAQVITDAAVDLLQPLREEAREARAETKEARGEVAALRRNVAEMEEVTREVIREMMRWRTAILHPAAKLPALRAMVTQDPISARVRNGVELGWPTTRE